MFAMTKDVFYRGKDVASVEWWLHDCDLPSLTWARLRVFTSGTADVCWEEGGTLFGFDERQFAVYYLCEDECRRLAGLDQEDDQEHGIRFSELTPPVWLDPPDQAFKYLGTY